MEPTFLTGIHIHKVRHLENIDIPLSAAARKNLILTGKNGSGKTSVLTALISHFEYVLSNSYAPMDKCQNSIKYNLKQIEQADDTEAGKHKKAEAQKSLKMWQTDLSRWTDGAVPEYTSLESLREKYFAGQFIFARFEDVRNSKVDISSDITKVNLRPIYKLSDKPVRQLAKYMASLKATQAFAKTEGTPKRAQEIENWFQRFEAVLRKIYGDDSLKLHFDIETFQFSILMNNREPFDFNTMSAGYAAVFDIIGDLMMRMESQRSYDLEGIVLIDEIETHLHVELQKQIVPILTGLFPNIQFIMTTHSPFILNSASNAVIYDLEKHTLVENGLTNLPYEGIVESYFGVDLLSQKLREKFEQYRTLVQKDHLTDEDFAVAAELELYLDEVPDYLALDFATEYSHLKLELANRG